jgi:hypothetical protein
VSIMRALHNAEIELFPPGSMIVQQPKTSDVEADEKPKERNAFE